MKLSSGTVLQPVKIGFESVTGTEAETSKLPPGQVFDLKG
jgi:hypothetical protein